VNPELKRNFLVEITPQRLIAMPLILGLIFTAASVSAGSVAVVTLSNVLFWVLVFLWGTRKAAGAFDAELANNTWDGQRLSALTAGQIFIGKLFGSTSFVLYGAVICLLANVAARLDLYIVRLDQPRSLPPQMTILDPGEIAWLTAQDSLSGLLGLVVAMFVAVVLMARTRATKGISVTLCQVFAIGVAGVFADRIANTDLTGFGRVLTRETSLFSTVNWYGTASPVVWFVTATLIVYLLWAVLGTVRQLRGVLQFRGYRWAWPLFVLFVGAYLAGFDVLYRNAAVFEHRAFAFLTVIWVTAATFTYFAVFTEPKSLQGYRSYVAAARQFRLLGIFEHQPFWITSLILVILALAANLVIGQTQTGPGGGINPELAALFLIGPSAIDLKVLLIVASLFLVRDCALVMALNFGRRRRRADLAALVYLAVLYLIVPLVLEGFNLDHTALMKFFLPRVDDGLVASAWPVLLQIAGLLIVIVLRWRTVSQPVVSDLG